MLMLALVVALQAAAPAEPLDEPPALSGRDVAVQFSGKGPQRYFPERALRAGVTGSAVVSCIVSSAGKLTDCFVESESPMGYGFGEATLRVASELHIAAKTKSGAVTAGRRFRLPMNFALP